MRISKMHGTGNDFILLPNLKEESWNCSGMARLWCDRHFGIGADGLIIILPSSRADFRMRIFNSDGSEAEMCGNGLRCFAKEVYEKKRISKPKFTVETLAGIMEPQCEIADGRVTSVRVNMGIPRYGDLHSKKDAPLALDSKDIVRSLQLPEGAVEGATVSMGNPHFVIFTGKTAPWKCATHGHALCVHPAHPHQSNIEFAEVLSPDAVRVSVWERGAGSTLACATGACAAVAAGRILKGLSSKIRVEMPGGPLEVEWDGQGPIFLTGPASHVYEGEVSEDLMSRSGFQPAAGKQRL